jgi:hypothetical protein
LGANPDPHSDPIVTLDLDPSFDPNSNFNPNITLDLNPSFDPNFDFVVMTSNLGPHKP